MTGAALYVQAAAGQSHRRRLSFDHAALAVVTVVGALLRLFPLRSVWLDEAISIGQARLPYGRMLTQFMNDDLHPPLWGSVLWLSLRVLGDGPLAVRIPSVIAGTACIPLTYLLGRELYDRRAGLAAAVLMAVAPLAVWYSGEARMYACYLLFSVLALLGQARVLNRGDRLGWTLFTLGSAAMIYTHYFSVLQLAAQHLIFAVAATRGRIGGHRTAGLRRPWMLSIAATAVLCLPLAPYAIQQLTHAGSPGGAATTGEPVSAYVVAANLVWSVWGYHADTLMTRLVALWPAAMLIVLALLGKGRSWATNLLVAAVLIPVLGALVISVRARTFFEVRYFISVLPALLLLAARAATGWLSSTAARATAAGLLALTLLAGLANEQFNPGNPRLYDYRSAFQYVAGHAQPGDLILYAPDYLSPVIDYYRPEPPAAAVREDAPLPPSPGRIFLIASFLNDPGTARLAETTVYTLEHSGRTVRQTRHWDNVTLWVLA
ncbi:glycosyltransferase family 39 protein [Actinoplanes sp. NPDC049599]|uniref:glycosyltransferase family 39 protein n=1 Tax=Actinoplanes sp. NPDC049599 TaxID=3363903 RepID=UPI0037AA70CC